VNLAAAVILSISALCAHSNCFKTFETTHQLRGERRKSRSRFAVGISQNSTLLSLQH